MQNKVVIIDWGILVHKAIFSLKFNPTIPATFTGMNMAIGWLYRLDIDPDDLILVAVDSRNCWRKDFETAYKGDRKQKRQDSGIDFNKWYGEFERLHQQLDAGLDWHFIKLERLEADDIMAVACRYYHDRPVVLVTHDADLEQMWEYPNVRIFSTYTKKWKVKPENFDVIRLQSEKIYKETTDNMVEQILTEQDFDIRRKCVDLIKLPDFVEDAVVKALDNVKPKPSDYTCIPFKSLWDRFLGLYNDKSKVISYEEQVAKEEAVIAREKRKKLEAKEKIKRKELKLKTKAEKEQAKLELAQIKEEKLLLKAQGDNEAALKQAKKLAKREAIAKIKAGLTKKKETQNVEICQSSVTEGHAEIKG